MSEREQQIREYAKRAAAAHMNSIRKSPARRIHEIQGAMNGALGQYGLAYRGHMEKARGATLWCRVRGIAYTTVEEAIAIYEASWTQA